MFTRLRLLLALISVAVLVTCAQAATLHGTIYEWSDFEKPLKNAIVEVEENSTRIQYNVSTTGVYRFDLSPGSYLIRARYYRNNILEYVSEESIQIEKADDSINLDLLLFPPTDTEYEYLGDINLTAVTDIKNEDNLNYYIIIPFLLVLLAAAVVLYWVRKKKTIPEKPAEPVQKPPEKPENMSAARNIELPEDLQELYNLILKKGGRVTQKDLRKEMKYSEAKVSLMLDDLEDRGLIKKIKKGRSNIIIASVQS